MTEHTYGGEMVKGLLALPTRTVPFVNGEPVELTDDEAALLGDDWKPTKSRKTSAPADDKATPATDKEA